MGRHATFVIPDISGFTEFISQTDLVFSSAVLCELLNELIVVADTRYVVAEVEGDAVLFYAPDQLLPVFDLTAYCIKAYKHFHAYLKDKVDRTEDEKIKRLMRRLTVKFICHHGEFTEINIQNFRKPIGLQIITAHRLLKNQVPDREYILLTTQCLGEHKLPQLCSASSSTGLSWNHQAEHLADIGEVNYYWSSLKNLALT